VGGNRHCAVCRIDSMAAPNYATFSLMSHEVIDCTPCPAGVLIPKILELQRPIQLRLLDECDCSLQIIA
jgi:hypothetical protein